MIAERENLHVAPVADAVKIENGVNSIGAPDGYHTGGAWHVEATDEVWKPLVDRWGYPTQEVEALTAGEGLPFFPRNWRVETVDGVRWLVRRKAYLMPEDFPYEFKNESFYLEVESAVRAFNARQWEVNDELKIAWDRQTRKPFFLDLSAAQYRTVTTGIYAADDWIWIERLFKAAKLDAFIKFRQNGREAHSEQMLERHERGLIVKGEPPFRHIYGSMLRPMNRGWARRLPESAYLMDAKKAPSLRDMNPHTWIFTVEPLADDVVESYELRWAWSY